MSSEYILTLEAIDRRLYSKDGSRPLMRFSSSDIEMPQNCHTPKGLSEECLNYMTEILTKHGRPNLRMNHFLFLHFGGWDRLMEYIRTDEKRRGFLLRCEEKGYSVAEERAAFDRMLVDGPAESHGQENGKTFPDKTGKKIPGKDGKTAPDKTGKKLSKRAEKVAGGNVSPFPPSISGSADAGQPVPSLHMRCIVEANIFIVKNYCGLYSGKGADVLREEIEGFLRNSPDEERHLSPQIDPADRYAIFRHIRGLLEEYDNARAEEAKFRALGTALAWLLLAALVRDRCRCLCRLLPQEVQILHIEEREALRGDLPAIAPVSMPPRTGRVFYGRKKELAWIGEEFRKKRSPVWITGDGGCGKTSLALRYAASIPDAYCIYAVFHNDLQSTVADIRFRDRLTYSEIPEEELYSFNLSRIAQYGSRLLLIIDNFDAPGYDMTFPEMLDAPCGECAERGNYADEDSRDSAATNFNILNNLCRTGARVLLTTRLHVPPQYASVCLSDEEHLLSRDELTALAKEIYDDHEWTEPEEVMMQEIVLAVGKHVMAVELIAAALKYNAGFSTIAEVLEKVRAGHYAQISGEARSGRGETGSGARRFRNSSTLYEQMTQLFSFSVFSKEQKALLRILSLLPQTGLDRPLFMELCEGIFAPEKLRQMLLRFRDLHLITLQPIVSMHSVTAELAADALRPDAENCGILLRNALAFCGQYEPQARSDSVQAAPGGSAGPAQHDTLFQYASARADAGGPGQAGTDPAFLPQLFAAERKHPDTSGSVFSERLDFRLLAQVSRLLMRCHDRIEGQSFSRAGREFSQTFISLTISLAEYRLGHHLTALCWAEKAMQEIEAEQNSAASSASPAPGPEMNSDKPAGTAVFSGELSGEADPSDEREIARLRVYAEICSALAQAEAAAGFYDTSVSHYQDAIHVRQKLPGGGIPEIATVYNDLSVVYCELGAYEYADECLQKALRIQTEVYGPDHMETSTTFNNLGLLRSEQGDPEGAIEYYEKSLRLHLSCHGELHPDTAVIYCNLGQEYSDLGDPDRAEDYLGRALRINTELFGEDYSGNAGICNNIGILYDDLSRASAEEDRSEEADEYYSEAFHWYWKSLSILEKNYGKEHPRTADLYLNMAFACLEHGEVINGFRCYESAIAILEKTFGPDHPKTLAAKEDYAAAREDFCT